jgi:casein kinase I homolog HRR25
MITCIERLHDCGFIHCDIKPDNILLAGDNMKALKSSEIVLIDFGLARNYLGLGEEHIEMKSSQKF